MTLADDGDDNVDVDDEQEDNDTYGTKNTATGRATSRHDRREG